MVPVLDKWVGFQDINLFLENALQGRKWMQNNKKKNLLQRTKVSQDSHRDLSHEELIAFIYNVIQIQIITKGITRSLKSTKFIFIDSVEWPPIWNSIPLTYLVSLPRKFQDTWEEAIEDEGEEDPAGEDGKSFHRFFRTPPNINSASGTPLGCWNRPRRSRLTLCTAGRFTWIQ